MKQKKLKRAAERYNRISGGRGYALSVWCLPGQSGNRIAAYSTEAADLSYPVFRASTVGQIREAGFELEQSGKPGHYTLWLPSPPSDTDWEKIDRIFGSPQPIVEVEEGTN